MEVDLKELNNTADTTDQFEAEDIERNKVMAILAYLGWLVLIPIFAAKESKYARFHANQGLVLVIIQIAWAIVQGIVGSVLRSLHLGFIASLLGIVNLAFLALLIIGIVNVVNGRAKELPIIGGIKILK